jgi:hypothetical protein
MTVLQRLPFLPLLAGLILALYLTAAAAQVPASPPPDSKAVEALLEVLKDDAARQALIEKLEGAKAAGETEPEGLQVVQTGVSDILSAISSTVERFSGQISQSADLVIRLPGLTADFADRVMKPENQEFWLSLSWLIALVLAAAFAAE